MAVVDAAHEGASCRVHLKVETGVNRQGIIIDELDSVFGMSALACGLQVVGVSGHYADIEDTTDRRFAQRQMSRFTEFGHALAQRGYESLCRHMSCSAAAILWDESHFDMVRVGISGYGIGPWPQTRISARHLGYGELPLRPVMTWKCRLAQIKEVARGESVGYGRIWKAPIDSCIGVLPVGYSDGYPRALSSLAHVLVRGYRMPISGRICMNLTMVDASSAAGDEVVLLGRQAEEQISAEHLAGLLNTISYEIVTLSGPT